MLVIVHIARYWYWDTPYSQAKPYWTLGVGNWTLGVDSRGLKQSQLKKHPVDSGKQTPVMSLSLKWANSIYDK